MSTNIEKLIGIVERLLGPGGCPWDQEQTMKSIRSSVLEEACEFIEAIDLGENHHMVEELGDLLFNVIFFCKLGEKEKRFELQEVVEEICAKLIRRHPHVFGNAEVKTAEEVLNQWEKIKKEEKQERKSIFDGIPNNLPSLLRAQKMIKKMPSIKHLDEPQFDNEEVLGQMLLDIARSAHRKGLDAEQALRNTLAHIEQEYRQSQVLAGDV